MSLDITNSDAKVKAEIITRVAYRARKFSKIHVIFVAFSGLLFKSMYSIMIIGIITHPAAFLLG